MHASLERLRLYATRPPIESPPEILPGDHGDRWGMDGAARAALGLILEGGSLPEMADYLLTFFNEGYGKAQFPDAPLLNGTALALCGYLREGAHPEAELWRVTGCARLATEAHNRKAALSERMLADCLLTVCEVADELQLPILADLITLRERMWGRLLDHSRAERLHVSEADYHRHMTTPLAPERLGTHLRSRPWQKEAFAPNFGVGADMREAEESCNNLFTLRNHLLVRHQFGSEIDWNIKLFDDIETTVSVSVQTAVRNLAEAYAETGKQKYPDHAARLLWSFYRLAPLPNHKQPGGPWRTLDTGQRQCNVWPGIIALLGQTDAFDEATHTMLARSRLEHIRYLLAYCGGANNWYQVEAAGIANAALYSPELRHADAFLRIAMRRLRWVNSFAYYDDGFQFELTHGYHVYPTSSLFSVIRVAKARGISLPEDFTGLVERAHEMYLYAKQPNHYLPTFNDCNPTPFDPAPLLKTAAEAFGRRDFRWGATHGEEGEAPDHTSHAWPNAGLYVMRDKWGEDAQYLHFDGAPWGAAHQHEDKLNFILYSHGRLLLGDPNFYSYSWTQQTHYFKSSRAHNVVLVDGKEQARRFQPETYLATKGRNEWVSRPGFDFVSSEYLDGFAPYPFEPRGAETEIERGLTHRRAVFYVKPGYWILSDLITGERPEHRRLEQVFHIAPIITPGAVEPVKAGAVNVSAAAIITEDEGLANLAILPVDTDGLSVRAQKGETSPAVGWYGVYGEFPAWDVTVETGRTLPARLDAVLWPMAAGATGRPTVHRMRSDAKVTAFHITGQGLDDTFILCEEGTGPVTVGDITFEGRALLLRRGTGRLRAMAAAPVTVQVEGRDIDVEQ